MQYKASLKATLEDGPDADKAGGNRNWIQVLANSLPSLVAALAFRMYDGVSSYETRADTCSSGAAR